MENKRKIQLEIPESTLEKIRESIYMSKNLHPFTEYSLPETLEEFIFGGIHLYIERIEKIKNLYEYDGNMNRKTNLKNKLKQILKQKGIKQRDVCSVTGIDEGGLSNILNNKNQPSLEVFIKIWIALGCPPIEDILYRE